MKSKKDVELLITILKSDKKMNAADISERLEISREHFTRLKKSDPDGLYTRLIDKFAGDLGMKVTTIGNEKPTYDQAVNKVLIREMAKMKSLVEKTSFEDALKDIDDKIDLVMS